MNALLRIINLNVSIEDEVILNDVNLAIAQGSVHALMGPNGSGKSTLAYTLAGHPRYTVTSGSVTLSEQDIVQLSPDKRAKLGLFLAFQQPYEIPGLSVFTFLKEAHQAITGNSLSVKEFQDLLQAHMKLLQFDSSFMYRNLNEGFSGGEKKRLEVLQMLVLQPTLVILDEIDSGLDIDALNIVGQAIGYARKENPALSVILITHYQRILHYIQPDYVHVLCNGTIVQSGDYTLAHEIEQKGYNDFYD